jgi:ABC-type ATPase involved in cell division
MSQDGPMNPQRPETAAASAPATGWAIELEKINKRFGAVHANKDIDLKVASGTIHGIVGENGAGKSTLMSILYGFYTADSGTIRVNGTEHAITDSRHALALGIGMVHQHFMLVDNFTVLENVVLGAEDSGLLKPSLDRARQELDRLEHEYDLEVDPDAIIEDISVGQQRIALDAQDDVFEHGEIVHQHEVLVHHADAQRQRMAAVGNGLRRAIDDDGAAIGRIESIQDRHQRRFTRAVLPHNAVDGAARDLEVDVLVGVNRAKPLVDLLQLDGPAIGWCRCSGRFRPLRVH